MKKVLVLIVGIATVLFYQNCAKTGFRTSADMASEAILAPTASIAAVTPADPGGTSDSPVDPATTPPVVTATSNPNNLAFASTVGRTAMQCYANFFSVYEWTNSDSDVMTTAPIFDATKKLGVIESYSDSTSSSGGATGMLTGAFDANVGWRIQSKLTTTATGTQFTTYMNKWNQNDMTEVLTCGFGPSANSAEAKLQYTNVGVGLNGVDGLTGYLSSSAKYIACKVTNSSRTIQFKGPGQGVLILPANKAFILKRGGC